MENPFKAYYFNNENNQAKALGKFAKLSEGEQVESINEVYEDALKMKTALEEQANKPILDEDSPEYAELIKGEIKFKIDKIKKWAAQAGYIEGKDFIIIESISDVETDETKIARHEKKQFAMGISEQNYKKFKDYFTGQYRTERMEENPGSWTVPKLYYSWGGRFAVGGDGATFFDTAMLSSNEKMAAPTHHQEFKDFFKQKTGAEFPSAEKLNGVLREISEKALSLYEEAENKVTELEKAEEISGQRNYNLSGLRDGLNHMVASLRAARDGQAVVDFPEIIKDKMPQEMRRFADYTYNIDDLIDLDRVAQVTGVKIPDEQRIDKIFERFGLSDRKKMEEICKDFSDYISAKLELTK